MRNNGLQAASWTSLAEVDPQVADALLELLADAGVAAYAVPSQGKVGGYLDIQPHAKPTDKVFVDSGAVRRAYEVVVAHKDVLEADFAAPGQHAPPKHAAPAPPEPVDPALVDPALVDDSTWRELVDRLESSPSLPDRAERADDAAEPAKDAEWSDVQQVVEQREDEQHHPELEDDPDDHFVPPEPPPLPESDQLTRWAWAGLLGGPGLLVLATLLGWDLGGWIVGVAIVGFLSGFGILVFRMKERPDVDDDPDAGAVV